MRNAYMPKSKGWIALIVIMAFFVVGLPLIATGLLASDDDSAEKSSTSKLPSYIKVYREKSDKVDKIPFEEYIACVVASEVPSTFHSEAIKAQAVAARTYAFAKILKYDKKHPSNHPNAPICDTTHCQAYYSEDKLIKLHPQGWENTGWAKIRKAVEATTGQIMYFDGKVVMQPLFFSSSGGQTENSEDVFTTAYPYLVSVDSDYENDATHRNDKTALSLKSFANKIRKAFPDYTFGKITMKNIKILSRTAGGRVDKIKIGSVTLEGTDVRACLGLSSSLFSISMTDNKITFTTNGSGHGVGLSQYGADGMAKAGYSYKQILKHYYTGVNIE